MRKETNYLSIDFDPYCCKFFLTQLNGYIIKST